MPRSLATWAFVLCHGCGWLGGAESPSSKVTWPPPVDASIEQGVRQTAASLLQGIEACRAGVMGSTSPEAAEQQAFPFGEEDLVRDCGPASKLYAEAAPAIGSKSRSGDVLLAAAARVTDDLEFLRLTVVIASEGSERRLAVEHVISALERAEQAARRAAEEPVRDYALRVQATVTPESSWARLLLNDPNGVGGLRGTFERLAFGQGGGRGFVRFPGLTSRMRIARGELAAREAALAESTLPAEELVPLQAYLQAVRHTVDAYQSVLDAFAAADGVVDDATRAALNAQADAADAAWKVAFEAECTRLGVTPEP